MNKDYRREHIKEMLNWPLEKKIAHAVTRIVEFVTAMGGPDKVYVAYSGGKDSTALLHLVRSVYPDIVAVFCNTTNEYVEILQFVKKTPNVITVNPKMTFVQTVEKYGFPLVSKRVAKGIKQLRENKPNTAKTRNLLLTGFTSEGGRLDHEYRVSLKPCPFCGGEAKEGLTTYGKKDFVTCTKCGAKTRNYHPAEESYESGIARKAWNKRTPCN